jgi:predicted bacteriocin transport accessory protein
MKTKHNNKKAILIIIPFIAIILVSMTIQSVGSSTNENINNQLGNGTNNNDEPSDDWVTAHASNDKQIIYLGRPSCSWCNKIRPELDDLKIKYNVDFVYVNVDKTSQDDLNTLFTKLDIKTEEFGTPYLAVIENGKKISEQTGYVPEEKLFKFYQDNGFIDRNQRY